MSTSPPWVTDGIPSAWPKHVRCGDNVRSGSRSTKQWSYSWNTSFMNPWNMERSLSHAVHTVVHTRKVTLGEHSGYTHQFQGSQEEGRRKECNDIWLLFCWGTSNQCRATSLCPSASSFKKLQMWMNVALLECFFHILLHGLLFWQGEWVNFSSGGTGSLGRRFVQSHGLCGDNWEPRLGQKMSWEWELGLGLERTVDWLDFRWRWNSLPTAEIQMICREAVRETLGFPFQDISRGQGNHW